jgi:hypothetical protein
LLNGAAATALLATGIEKFYQVALFFAVGAAVAIVAAFFAYLYTLLLVQTWIYPPQTNIPFLLWKISARQIALIRIIPIAVGAASLFLFVKVVVGVAYAGMG